MNGQLSWYYLGGTSMASPHVAGIAALMAQEDPSITQSEVESVLKSFAVPLPAGTRTITNPNGFTEDTSWGDDASGSGLVTAPAALAAIP